MKSSLFKGFEFSESTYPGHTGRDLGGTPGNNIYNQPYYVPDFAGAGTVKITWNYNFTFTSGLKNVYDAIRNRYGWESWDGTGSKTKNINDAPIITIYHDNGLVTRYIHSTRDQIYVTDGQRVTTGDVIGRVGEGGIALGAHLHFEVLESGLDKTLFYLTSTNIMPTNGDQYITVQAGWGVSQVALEAGFADYGEQSRWNAIAQLNGHGSYHDFYLNPGDRVLVKKGAETTQAGETPTPATTTSSIGITAEDFNNVINAIRADLKSVSNSYDDLVEDIDIVAGHLEEANREIDEVRVIAEAKNQVTGVSKPFSIWDKIPAEYRAMVKVQIYYLISIGGATAIAWMVGSGDPLVVTFSGFAVNAINLLSVFIWKKWELYKQNIPEPSLNGQVKAN